MVFSLLKYAKTRILKDLKALLYFKVKLKFSWEKYVEMERFCQVCNGILMDLLHLLSSSDHSVTRCDILG